MNDTVDLLKIKIEKAKRELPLETVNAIDAVDWRATILELRSRKGYTFEQLGDLEIETELLLSGLVSPENYPKELEKRMGISKAQANELVNEMNDLVFKKIREELVKNTERKKIFQKTEKSQSQMLEKTGIEFVGSVPVTNPKDIKKEKPIESREDILKRIEKPEPTNKITNEELRITNKEEIHPMLAQKLSTSLQIPTVKTDHTLQNLSSSNKENITTTIKSNPKMDPYRETPE